MVENADSEATKTPSAGLPPEDAALLETLTPELARLLFPEQVEEPFTVTLRYPRIDGAAAAAVGRLEALALEVTVSQGIGDDAPEIHSTTFGLAQIEEFHELYHLAESTGAAAETDVLLNRREVPLTRELWLPLLWSLRK